MLLDGSVRVRGLDGVWIELVPPALRRYLELAARAAVLMAEDERNLLGNQNEP